MQWNELANPSRLEKMKSAMIILADWQEATYRLPVLENSAAFLQEIEQIAAIMVDNHLGKLARRIRLLSPDGRLDSSEFLDRWSQLHFFSRLWSRFDLLPDGLKLNLLYQSGPNITAKHLLQEDGLKDRFLVTGQQWAMEERLQRRSVYLYGMEHKRFFVLLDYRFNQQPFARYYQTGMLLQGEVRLYPYPGSFRISNEQWEKFLASASAGSHRLPERNLSQVVEEYSTLLKVNPFCDLYPVVLTLRSDHRNNEWKVTDSENQEVRMVGSTRNDLFSFYSACFRNPLLVMGLCSLAGFQPLSYYNGETYVSLDEMALSKSNATGEASEESPW